MCWVDSVGALRNAGLKPRSRLDEEAASCPSAACPPWALGLMGLLGDLMSSWEGTADRTLIALRACVCVWRVRRVSVCVCVFVCSGYGSV